VCKSGQEVFAVVAQLARVPACHAGGRGFESHQPLFFAVSGRCGGSNNSVEESQGIPARANRVIDVGVAEGAFGRLDLTAEMG
jgi:hypothetical protein